VVFRHLIRAVAFLILLLIAFATIFPRQIKAQFTEDFGAISGTVRWGTYSPTGSALIDIQNPTTGFKKLLWGNNFNTGFILPSGTYEVAAQIFPQGGNGFLIDRQTVEVVGTQVTTVNFDALTLSGLVKGSLAINSVPANGQVQFCGPLETDPCPVHFRASDGPLYGFNGSFAIPLLPGDYRVHVVTSDYIDVGIVPITVVSGQIYTDPALDFALDFGAISGTVRWGTYSPTGSALIDIQNPTTGFKKLLWGNNFNTGFILPSGTYEVAAQIFPQGGNGFLIDRQTVEVVGTQVTTVNFDALTLSGLVKGSLAINSVPANGQVQFCGPLETDPCPVHFRASDGPLYGFNGSFAIPLLPGDYRVHVVTLDYVDLGIIPITVVAEEIVDLSTSAVLVPTGQNVRVTVGNVKITFTEVTTSGYMIVSVTDQPQGGLPPSAFRFLGKYYELTTTALYTGPVTVSIAYNDADVRGKEENLKLFHWDGTNWQNITTSVDTINNIITGVSPTISPFAIGEPIDTTPPITIITPSGTLGNNGLYVSDVSVSLTATDGDGLGVEKTEYSLDGGLNWVNYTSAFIISDEGETLIKAHSTDFAGNTETPVELVLKVDRSASVTTITTTGTLGDNGWYTSDVSVSLSATDTGGSGLAKTEYSLDIGTTWTTYTSPFIIANEGVGSVKARSIDIAGNVEVPIELSIKVDKSTSITNIIPSGTLGSNNWYTSDISITLSGTDVGGSGLAKTEYSLDGGITWLTYTAAFIVSKEGITFVKARSVDIAGNIESPVELSIKIDKSVSTINITPTGTFGENSWYISDVDVSLSAEDPVSGVDSIEYNLDGGVTWTSYISVFTVTKEGITNVKVRSSDIAGNVSIPVDFTIRIDKTNPSITDSQLSSYVIANGSSTTISARATDVTSDINSVTYRLNDGISGSGSMTFDPTTEFWQVTISPTTGVYSVRVETTDIAGHRQVSDLLFLAVYDPTAGFVTGGGWFIPEDASRIGISSGGKANLGFEVKYDNNNAIPQGNLTLHNSQDSLEFKSTAMEWLVVSGSSADFQGQATLNGSGTYTFRVHIADGEPDRFEIRIWASDGTFDNPKYRASNTLSRGNIVIH